MPKPFADLTDNSQRLRMRAVAEHVLKQWPGEPVALRCVNHGFNTTFRVDYKDGKRSALRINLNSVKPHGDIITETQWTRALSESNAVNVPCPLPSEHGEYVVPCMIPGIEHQSYAVNYSWCAGRLAGDFKTANVYLAHGKSMRALHEHGKTWRHEPPGTLRVGKDALDGAPNRLEGSFPDQVVEQILTNADRAITKSLNVTEHPVHFDLHPWNALWDGAKHTVIDFDDMRTSSQAFDLGIALFYIRKFCHDGSIEAAFREGLETSNQDMGVTDDELEWIVASRALMLANEFKLMVTKNIQEIIPKYIEATNKRLDHFFSTGKFDPKVASIN